MERPLTNAARPKQARSRRTLERILDAAERLLLARGLADVSVADIVAEAGVSVGSLYGRFRDKDEVLRALHERRLTLVAERIDRLARSTAAVAPAGAQVVALAMAELVAYYGRGRRLIAAFLAHAAADPRAWAGAIAHHGRVAEALAALLGRTAAADGHLAPQRAALLAVHVVFAYLDHHALYADVPGVASPFEGDELAHELARVVTAYLGAEAGPR